MNSHQVYVVILTLLISIGFIKTLHANTLVGIPNLLDGDTIEIENQVIRLDGIWNTKGR